MKLSSFIIQIFLVEEVACLPAGRCRCLLPIRVQKIEPVVVEFPSCDYSKTVYHQMTVLTELYGMAKFLQQDVVAPVLNDITFVNACPNTIADICLSSFNKSSYSIMSKGLAVTDKELELIFKQLFNKFKHFARMVQQLIVNNRVFDGSPDGHNFPSTIAHRQLEILLNHLTDERVYCQLKRLAKDANEYQLDRIPQQCKFAPATNCESALREIIVLKSFQEFVIDELQPLLIALCDHHPMSRSMCQTIFYLMFH